MPRMEAAIDGAREIGFAIVAMTLTLASVFAPLAFATGRTGRPVHRVRADAGRRGDGVGIHRAHADADDVLAAAASTRTGTRGSTTRSKAGSRALTEGYRRVLTVVAAPSLAGRDRLVRASLALGALFFTLLKAELSPTEDRGVVFGLVTAPQGSTPQYTADQIKPIEEFYAQIPEAAAYTAISGFPTVVDGNAVLRLKPGRSARSSSSRSPTSCGRSSRRSPARSPSRSIRRRSDSRSARRRSNSS